MVPNAKSYGISECCGNPNVHPPVAHPNRAIQCVHEIGEWAEGEFGEVEGQDVLRGFRVSLVEVCYKSLCGLDIFRWSPLIFLNAVPFPMHKVFKFTLEDTAVQNMFYFIFFDPVTDYGGWQV